ncbi:hypothetical protein BDF20DRAFT_846129 [Mycotypha africana]|uniref:uncharacterized protein n=1 Tax=Mycotypha africana TaxID=64632 RepID=UPI002301AA66|nr:uncharacterized protein BDF20DRAFT_846129 [Mycotypha africana]KAI8991732.1 hypothetical protein BDF20DRAFT_846129 [Mycotypha africana]
MKTVETQSMEGLNVNKYRFSLQNIVRREVSPLKSYDKTSNSKTQRKYYKKLRRYPIVSLIRWLRLLSPDS